MVIDINPVVLDLGFIQIHWYGLMYMVAFMAAYWLGNVRAKNNSLWNKEQVSDLIFYGAMGVVIGGRVGYVLFYDLSGLLADPLKIFKVWEGGMSFHGGLIGVLVAGWLFGRRYKKTFFEVTDFVAPLVPIGLGAGRMGNFINGELWGKATDLPWGMIFKNSDSLGLTRHPSMLYEMFLEGIVMFVIIWWFSAKKRPLAAVSGLWIILYGCFRFVVEFVRVPDVQLGYLAWDWLTMGQVLSLPMVLAGLIVMVVAYKRDKI